MAQLAGVYQHAPGDAELARGLWSETLRAFRSPSAVCDVGPVSVGLFRQHAGERILATADATLIGFGGTSPDDDSAALAPPWLRCRYQPSAQRLVLATDRRSVGAVHPGWPRREAPDAPAS